MNFVVSLLFCLVSSSQLALADPLSFTEDDEGKDPELSPQTLMNANRQPRSSLQDINLNCQEGDPLGVSYVGSTNSTSSGRVCQVWAASQPHEHTNTHVGDHNECRNPDGDQGGVWCYITDPDKRWENYDVPECVLVTKVLDFSTDNDDQQDENGKYTSASLEIPSHPESFTVCSAFMVDAWKPPVSSARMFGLLNDKKEDWLGITLSAKDLSTGYKVGFLSRWAIIADKSEQFWPLQWSRVCLSLDTVNGSMILVVDGELLGEAVYSREEDQKKA